MILNRYLTKQLIIMTCVLTVILTFSTWLTQSIRLMDLLVNNDLGLGKFLIIASLLLQGYFLSWVIPVGAFIATLMLYNRLKTDSEITVAFATGHSPFQLLKPALVTGALLFLILSSMTHYLEPLSRKNFVDTSQNIRQQIALSLFTPGSYNEFKGGTIFILSRSADDRLNGIQITDQRTKGMTSVLYAREGYFDQNFQGDLTLYLRDGLRIETETNTQTPQTLYFDENVFTLENTSTNKKRLLKVQELSTPELFEELKETPSLSTNIAPALKERNSKRHAELVTNLFQRFLVPLQSFLFVVLAALSMLYKPATRRGNERQIFYASVAMILCEVATFALLSQSNNMIELSRLTPLPSLILMLYCVFLFFKSKRLR